MRKKNIIAMSLLITSMSLSAVASETNAIDKALEACTTKNYSTVGMQECTDIAYKQWDEALNAIYGKLIKEPMTGKDGVAALKETQRHWLKFRDTETQFINQFYRNQEGSYWGTVAGEMKLDMLRVRVKTLQSYLDSLNPAG